jgi:hypothetical protein
LIGCAQGDGMFVSFVGVALRSDGILVCGVPLTLDLVAAVPVVRFTRREMAGNCPQVISTGYDIGRYTY